MSKADIRAQLALLMDRDAVKITKVPTGERALGDLNARDWNRILQTPRSERTGDPINKRHVVTDHMGRERVRNGLGEWID